VAYQDHIRNSSDERPHCWGNSNTFSMEDFECQGCRYQHSCRAEVAAGGGSSRSVHIRPTVINRGTSYRKYRRNDDDDGLSSSYESGIVEDGERAIERFAKDCAGGALRGLFYEAWQFFRNFRFR
jgi:hypothetical protein